MSSLELEKGYIVDGLRPLQSDILIPKEVEDNIENRLDKLYMVTSFYDRIQYYNMGKSIYRVVLPTVFAVNTQSMLMRERCNEYTTVKGKSDKVNRCVTCWDSARYLAHIWERFGIKYQVGYIDSLYKGEDRMSVHIIHVLNINDMYYWVEPFWSQCKGIKGFNHSEDAFNYALDMCNKYDGSTTRVVTYYDPLSIDLNTCLEYKEWMENVNPGFSFSYNFKGISFVEEIR